MQFQLRSRQVCLFFIAFLPITKFFILPSILAKNSNEDMWLSALASTIFDIATLSAVLFTCKKTKTDFYGLLKLNFGKVIAKIIMALYFVFFMLKAVIPIHEQKNYVELTLYETMPNFLDFLPFFAVAFFMCLKGVRVWGRCADILWIITAIGLIFIFALSITNCDFQAILPIGANGFNKILKGSYFASNWFGDCVYLVFFIGQFECRKKDILKVAISYAIGAIAVIFFMILFYGIFTSIAHRQLFALTETSKYSTVINNIGRFDYVGIICILFSSIFSLSLPLYFATYTLKKICGFSSAWIPALVVNGSTLLFMILFNGYFASITAFMKNYASAFFILMANILPIFTVLLKKEKKYEVVKE